MRMCSGVRPAFVFAVICLTLAPLCRADGLIIVLQPPPQFVPRGHFSFAPLEVSYHRVNVDINDQVATTTVDQEFYNPNPARLEGTYLVPLPDGAHVDRFAMRGSALMSWFSAL